MSHCNQKLLDAMCVSQQIFSMYWKERRRIVLHRTSFYYLIFICKCLIFVVWECAYYFTLSRTWQSRPNSSYFYWIWGDYETNCLLGCLQRTSVNVCQTTRRHIPDRNILQSFLILDHYITTCFETLMACILIQGFWRKRTRVFSSNSFICVILRNHYQKDTS
jgi:hypothetical protein